MLREFDKRSRHLFLVIILLILITFSLDDVWILLGENWCWSPLGLKGLNHLLGDKPSGLSMGQGFWYFAEKKAKFRGIFKGKFEEKLADFVGFSREKSQNSWKNRPISREKSQNSQKNWPILRDFSGKESNFEGFTGANS